MRIKFTVELSVDRQPTREELRYLQDAIWDALWSRDTEDRLAPEGMSIDSYTVQPIE